MEIAAGCEQRRYWCRPSCPGGVEPKQVEYELFAYGQGAVQHTVFQCVSGHRRKRLHVSVRLILDAPVRMYGLGQGLGIVGNLLIMAAIFRRLRR